MAHHFIRYRPLSIRERALSLNRSKGLALSLSKGFTLIELIVVMGIFAIVTSIVLANNNRFGGTVLLRNLAYDIALSIRQAQVYGISVRSFGAGNFTAGYGMHFDMASPTTYVFFGDAVSQNGVYDQGEIIASTDIGRGYSITSLCAASGGNEQCNFSTLDVVYKRPEPDARITARSGGGQSCVENPNQCEESARIIVRSPRGDEMSIVIEAVGQIGVQ